MNKISEKFLVEMAISRGDAIDLCITLGKRFVEHFDKIYNENDEDTMRHHAAEMQAWYDKVKNITLKSNNKKLSNSQLIDWFLTAGQSVDELFDNDIEEDVYNEFFIKLLSNNNVRESLVNVELLTESINVYFEDID